MTALKIIGVILLIFLLIGFLRVGATISYHGELRVQLRVGAIKLTVFPRRKKKAKKEKQKQPEEKTKEDKPKDEKPKKKRSIPRPTLDDIRDLLETALSALRATARRACRRTRVDPLDATILLGADDPADVAVLFGTVNTAVFTLMPKMEETFYIPNPSIRLRMDFDRNWPTANGSLGISLRVCDLLAILFTLVIPLGKWLLRFLKAHRHESSGATAKSADAENNEYNDTEEQSA